MRPAVARPLDSGGPWTAWLPSLALACAIPLGGVLAQPPTGSHVDATPGMPSASQLEDAARRNRFADAYAACVARDHRRAAEDMLAEPYASPAQARIASRISDPDCLGPNAVQLRYRPELLVGRIAQFFIHQRFAGADVARFAGMSDEAADLLGLAPRNTAEDMASCVLRRDPEGVRALLDTPWDSSEEAAAIRRLTASFGPCAPSGSTLSFNAAAVRVMLAAGLYRALAAVSAVPPAR